MRLASYMLAAAGILAGGSACADPSQVSERDRRVITDSLTTLVRQAYDFTRPGIEQRLLSLYPDSGRVISAAAGRVTKTHEELAGEIAAFWQRVGRNMQSPRFVIGSQYVDVITRDAVVMTFTYAIPHHTPTGAPHTVSGAWTTLWRNQRGHWVIVQEHLSDTPESTTSPADSARTP